METRSMFKDDIGNPFHPCGEAWRERGRKPSAFSLCLSGETWFCSPRRTCPRFFSSLSSGVHQTPAGHAG